MSQVINYEQNSTCRPTKRQIERGKIEMNWAAFEVRIQLCSEKVDENVLTIRENQKEGL